LEEDAKIRRRKMNPIQFECPHCREIITGDDSLYGQRVKCPKCQTTILVPSAPVIAEPQTARLIQVPTPGAPAGPATPAEETEVFKLSPVARSFPGHILLGLLSIALAVGVAFWAQNLSWPRWIPLVPLALGLLILLLVSVRAKSSSYRLTTQRLFVRRGWLSKHVNELELYRVKDVKVDQGGLQRLLGYGTVTVLSADDTTPETDLVGVAKPVTVKETIRTQYRAARQREGVHPTEFIKSP
jgi:membrane protein YdbS with pleckstrin-like domain